MRSFVEREAVPHNEHMVAVEIHDTSSEEQELDKLRNLKKQIDVERNELPSVEWINQQIEMIDVLLERGQRDYCTLESCVKIVQT